MPSFSLILTKIKWRAMMAKIDTLKIWKYSHHFVVVVLDQHTKKLPLSFSRRFIKYKLVYENGRYSEIPDLTFAQANESKTQFRFHINVFTDFVNLACQFFTCCTEDIISCTEEIPLYVPQKVNLNFLPHWSDLPKQVEPIQWGLDKIDSGARTLLYLWQMGHGKSYMMSRCAVHSGGRIVFFIQPKYVGKWYVDFNKMFGLSEKEIPYFGGTPRLLDLTKMDWAIEEFPIVMISIETFIGWIKLYKANDYQSLSTYGFEVDPPNLLEHLGASAYIRDEVHEVFHNMFYIDMYAHCPLSINATATLISDIPMVREAQKIMFPKECINEQKELDIYVEVVTAKYHLIHGKNIKTTEPRCRMHSTTAIEKNLMKNKVALKAYISCICRLIKEEHLSRASPGDKCMVYCAYTEFIDVVVKEIKNEFKDMKVVRYVNKDVYDHVLESDITITNKHKSGTAIDIPGLLTVIDAHIQKASIAIIQNLGRLRLRKDNKAPRYVRMVCLDWQKQVDYQLYARMLLRDRIKNETVKTLGFVE